MITWNNAALNATTNNGAIFGDLSQVRFTTAMSFSMWITLNSSWTLQPQAFAKGNGSNGCYFAFVYSTRKLRFYCYTSAIGGYTLTSNTDISSTELQHWVGVKDATQMRLYLNGVLDASYAGTPSSNIYSSSQPLHIGGSVPASYSGTWAGKIYDLRLYNRVLSETEIGHIHSSKGNDGISSGMTLRTCIGDGCVGLGSLNGKNLYDHSGYRAIAPVTGSHVSNMDPYNAFPTEDA